MSDMELMPKSALQILVVDDSTSYRRLLARHLQNWGYQVVEAPDGVVALNIIQHQNISLVISDWEMPDLNGVELCKAVREANFSHYVYFILVTSRGTSEDLVLGMEAGADDFLAKPIDQQELRVRLRAGERILQLEARLEERNQRLKEAYHVIEQDLQAAARMQQALLPRATLDVAHWDCQWFFLPSLFVSGDMLNFFRLDEQHVAFYTVDVAGHGVKSAMLSVTLNRFLSIGSGLVRRMDAQTGQWQITSPAQVVTELNNQFQMEKDDLTYSTMVYGILNTQTGRGRLVRAGHPEPVIIHADGSYEIIEQGSVPVGMIPHLDYEDTEFQLRTGSRLYLYTDGITECSNPEGELFGEQRLLSILLEQQKNPLISTVKDLQQRLYTWHGTAKSGFDDDVSMLVLGWQQPEQS